MPTQPRPDQIQSFVEHAPKGPIYMLNLLKFKERAEYEDGRKTELTGQQAYALYGEGVGKLIAELGGRLVWAGVCNAQVIGDGALPFDQVAIVEYPSLEAFQKMTSSAAYADVHVHRAAGLAHQLLIHCLSPQQAMAVFGSR
jgi:uncharacterized protein (DUF1330 family)